MLSPDPYTLISIVSAAIYLTIIAGILILARHRLLQLVDIIKRRRRLDPSRRRGRYAVSAENYSGREALNRHLKGLLSVTMKKPISPTAFIALCIGMFFTVFTSSATNLSPGVSALTAAAFSSLPYLGLRVSLERIRRRGSYEGENLVASFLTQYWISCGNVADAMERTISRTPNIAITGRLMKAFLMEARSTGNRERINAAARDFAYGVGTHWADMLAYNIAAAMRTGEDISLAIEDILSQLREARSLAEERKRINGESVRLIVFLIPASYIGSFFVSVTLLGISPVRFLRNQFATAEGFGFFVAAAFLFFINLMMIEIMMNRKLDF
jgi:hypothetical protein